LLVHVVLFDFKKDVTDDKKEEVLAHSRETLTKLPGVRNLVVGKNIKEDGGQSFALSMYFENSEALESYRIHPDHEKFRDNDLFPYLENIKGMDYED